jgi:hypothetical protein
MYIHNNRGRSFAPAAQPPLYAEKAEGVIPHVLALLIYGKIFSKSE